MKEFANSISPAFQDVLSGKYLNMYVTLISS